ncbi:hypothetical protein [Peribacillus frigoritolerans]|uniref:hypothetical protein n=1 Tax=Peribacillus frigoritolerans TaxID=450367 RepID=UPI0037FFCE71
MLYSPSVIIKQDAVTTALAFDYDKAKETLIRVLQGNFNIQTDDASIYMSEKPGEAMPVFSYRAFSSPSTT